MRPVLLAIFLLLAALPAYAGGDLYFGRYLGQTFRAYPDGGNAQFVAGIRLDRTIGRITPRVELQTLMDAYNGNGSFHPGSIKYDVGGQVMIYDGAYIDISRMCWHPVDRQGRVEEYWLAKVGYKW